MVKNIRKAGAHRLDVEFVADVISSLSRAGVESAFLHDEAAAAKGTLTSDLDLAVRCDPFVAMSLALPLLGERIFLILAAYTDVGGAVFVLYDTQRDTTLQLDLAFDTSSGRFGLKAYRLVPTASLGIRWLTVSPLDRDLYILRKALIRQQSERAAQTRSRLRRGFFYPEIARRARETYSPRSADQLLKSMCKRNGLWPEAFALGRRTRSAVSAAIDQFVRRRDRVLMPAGYWVHMRCTGGVASSVAPLASDLARLLPQVHVLKWRKMELFSAEWRRLGLGVVLTAGRGSQRRANLELSSSLSLVDAKELVLRGMRDHAGRTLAKLAERSLARSQ